MLTCDQGFRKSTEIYWGRMRLVNHVTHPLAPGLWATTRVGSPPASPTHLSVSPFLPPSSCHNNGEVCGSPKHTNDQVLNIYSTCVLLLSRGVKSKPLVFMNLYFSKTAFSPWQIIFKAGGAKASVWFAIIKLTFTAEPLIQDSEESFFFFLYIPTLRSKCNVNVMGEVSQSG